MLESSTSTLSLRVESIYSPPPPQTVSPIESNHKVMRINEIIGIPSSP